jgi:hypothetical protein
LSHSFQQAFEQLLARAPGPVFPRARTLYFQKYPLEGAEADALPFRTFLLEEEVLEGSAGVLRIRARGFAVVHWQAPPLDNDRYAAYLAQRWQLAPADLLPVEGESWFREGGAFARFSHPAVFERSAPTSLLGSPQSVS